MSICHFLTFERVIPVIVLFLRTRTVFKIGLLSPFLFLFVFSLFSVGLFFSFFVLTDINIYYTVI